MRRRDCKKTLLRVRTARTSSRTASVAHTTADARPPQTRAFPAGAHPPQTRAVPAGAHPFQRGTSPKEKRFPNRFHKRMTAASLSKRKGFRFSFVAASPAGHFFNTEKVLGLDVWEFGRVPSVPFAASVSSNPSSKGEAVSKPLPQRTTAASLEAERIPLLLS